ncbi:MAG: zeta toxin family protein [Gammaproteobacteria bacterium]|nr:zeta toxin family protein [Gammaproteobacteria bacterium]MDE0611631.1 zeta toxin family protein [Gammaproteobacteria bacterium]
MASKKRILIIAGPNGAGKTTFAAEFLPHEAGRLAFVNADLIAQGLSPFQPSLANFQAGRIMVEMIREYVRRGESFAFETTLSGLNYSRLIPHWREQGYFVKLVFLWLATPEIALDRIRHRVEEGGHDVPESVARRRFRAGWSNFRLVYSHLVDEVVVYDNSGPMRTGLEGD